MFNQEFDKKEALYLNSKIDNIVKDIYSRYNTSRPEAIKAALHTAVWTGMCVAKGWIEESGDD